MGFHNLQINKIGDGINMYVKNRFKTKIISNCNVSNIYLETLFLSLSIGSFNFTSDTVYKPPQVEFDIFINTLNSFIIFLTTEQSRDETIQ